MLIHFDIILILMKGYWHHHGRNKNCFLQGMGMPLSNKLGGQMALIAFQMILYGHTKFNYVQKAFFSPPLNILVHRRLSVQKQINR